MVQWAARRPADLPLYPTAAPDGALRGDPDLAAAAAVLGELPATLRHSVTSVSAPEPDQVTLQLAGGITVLWGDTDRAGVKARELTVLMRGAHALLRRERAGVRRGQVIWPDAQDPPIRDTLTGSRVVS